MNEKCPAQVAGHFCFCAEEYLEGRCAGFGDGVVLIARAAAYTDGSYYFSVFLERDATGEDHHFAVVGSMDAEELTAGL